MRFRAFIWTSSVALILLILVQFYFITETFHTKQEQFDSRYGSLATMGLYEFEQRYYDRVQDSLLSVLDDYSYLMIHDLGFSNDPMEKDTIKQIIYREFSDQINQGPGRERFLRDYFKKAGESADFITACLLREVVLLSFGAEINIYTDSINKLPASFRDGYLLNSYTIERNFFRIRYDYYISFTLKAEKISKEMRLTKTLSLVSLLIVFGVFFLTLRNLFIQKRLSELKTDFINNMTHELKTPLSTIAVASSSLALDGNQTDRQKVIAISEIIKKQNRHLSQLIDKILDISIWEKDQVKIECSEIDIVSFINEISESFLTANPGVSLTLSMQDVAKTETVRLDAVHFTTVINNLLSNAVKYGGLPPEIILSIHLNDMLTVKVRDNGSGIPEDEQRHIFEKFYRGKETKKKAIRGLGLGLYYVKQIIEAHGGEVFLDSSNGIGTEFIIKIPR